MLIADFRREYAHFIILLSVCSSEIFQKEPRIILNAIKWDICKTKAFYKV